MKKNTTGFIKNIFIAMFFIFFFQKTAMAINSEKEMECIYRGVETVSFHYYLTDGDLFVDGEKARSITSGNLALRLSKVEGKDVYLYARMEPGAPFVFTSHIDFEDYLSEIFFMKISDPSEQFIPSIVGECRKIN